jgi:hypothetical protein
MNPKAMEEQGLHCHAMFSASLSAWKLAFNKTPFADNAPPGQGLANIVPTDNGQGMMEGVLYEIDEGHLPKLDEIHRCPKEYTRMKVRVTKHDFTTVGAFVYVAREDKTNDKLRPSKAVMQKIRGAKKQLQMLYFSRLMNIPTCD